MKLIIAGTRTLTPSVAFIDELMQKFGILFNITEVLSGGARGVDRSGEDWAKFNNDNSPEIFFSSARQIRNKLKITIVEADWDTHGKAAGPIRNKEMAEKADALLLIWDGKSKGSSNMKSEIQKLGKKVYEVIIIS